MLHALHSTDPVIVYIDVKSPYAFVAIEPTLALERTLGVQFDWRPLTLDIPSYLGSAKKTAGRVVENNRSPKQWQSVKYAYRDARRYAQRQGHILKGTEKIWDSSLANIGILWAARECRARLPDYLQAVYVPFWRRELDIEDPDVIQACLHAAEIPTAGWQNFLDHEGREQHDGLQTQLHPAGVYGVPTYVVEHEVLFGREHLPYVEWMLRGKQGPCPDIAYTL